MWALLVFIGLLLILNGVRFFRTAVPLLAFFLASFVVYSSLSDAESTTIFMQVILILVSVTIATIVAIFSRGLFSIALFWLTIVSSQSLVSNFLTQQSLPNFASQSIALLVSFITVYVVFFSSYAYLIGIAFSSFVGSILVFLGIALSRSSISSGALNDFITSQPDSLLYATVALFGFGVASQVFIHHYKKRPHATSMQWGLESHNI